VTTSDDAAARYCFSPVDSGASARSGAAADHGGSGGRDEEEERWRWRSSRREAIGCE
jgi:hypothetical protein